MGRPLASFQDVVRCSSRDIHIPLNKTKKTDFLLGKYIEIPHSELLIS